MKEFKKTTSKKTVKTAAKAPAVVTLTEDARKASKILLSTLDRNDRHETVLTAQGNLSVAVKKVNAARQTDHIDAVISGGGDVLTAICKCGLYDALSFVVKKGKDIGEMYAPVPVSFPSAVAAFNAAGVASVGAEWQVLALRAVKLSAVQLATELEVSPDSYIKRLNLDEKGMEIVRRDFNAYAASRADVQTALQAAVNALFGLTDSGKPRYFVVKADVRALAQMFGWNKATNSVVVPMESTMNDMFFSVLRHVVGGVEYKIDVKEKKAAK